MAFNKLIRKRNIYLYLLYLNHLPLYFLLMNLLQVSAWQTENFVRLVFCQLSHPILLGSVILSCSILDFGSGFCSGPNGDIVRFSTVDPSSSLALPWMWLMTFSTDSGHPHSNLEIHSGPLSFPYLALCHASPLGCGWVHWIVVLRRRLDSLMHKITFSYLKSQHT